MGSPAGDHREGHPEVSRTSRRRPLAPEATPEPKPYVPSPEFERAYANPHNELGPILTRWNERGIAEWLLPTSSSRVVGGIPARNRL
jgi:hypothetical protein